MHAQMKERSEQKEINKHKHDVKSLWTNDSWQKLFHEGDFYTIVVLFGISIYFTAGIKNMNFSNSDIFYIA